MQIQKKAGRGKPRPGNLKCLVKTGRFYYPSVIIPQYIGMCSRHHNMWSVNIGHFFPIFA